MGNFGVNIQRRLSTQNLQHEPPVTLDQRRLRPISQFALVTQSERRTIWKKKVYDFQARKCRPLYITVVQRSAESAMIAAHNAESDWKSHPNVVPAGRAALWRRLQRAPVYRRLRTRRTEPETCELALHNWLSRRVLPVQA